MTPSLPRPGAMGWRPPLPPAVVAAFLVAAGLVLAGQGIYIHAKALLAQVLLERAFAAGIASGHPVKPWSWADTWPIARIRVQRLGASAIVLAGASGQALAFGPGHLAGTPMAGEPGTAVYAAHRDTHFRFLRRIAIGDVIETTDAVGMIRRFRVTRTSIAPWNAAGIDVAAPGRNLVLATCWPLDASLHGPLRYLAHAVLVPSRPTDPPPRR